MKARPRSLRAVPPAPEPLPRPIAIWIAECVFAAAVLAASVLFIGLLLSLAPCDTPGSEMPPPPESTP